ncbi:MAG: hypothetical protein ACXVJZ_06775 [Acidimicrobiia bacterium]
MTRPRPTVEVAARNNAAWCEVVARTHGVAGTIGPQWWAGATRTPPLYPDAVTLAPGADAAALLAAIDPAPGASVKDSFADLDLARFGFSVRFDATWTARTAPAGPAGSRLALVDPPGFAAWERSWRGADGPGDVLRPALLDDPRVTLLGAECGGAVVFRSAGVVGVSNVFGGVPVWPELAAWLDRTRPGVAAVGYETGPELEAARAAGFEVLGPLRVWVRGG